MSKAGESQINSPDLGKTTKQKVDLVLEIPQNVYITKYILLSVFYLPLAE